MIKPAYIGLAVVVIGVVVAGYGTYDYLQQSEAIDDAVTVDATVTRSNVTTVVGERAETYYEPRVTYEYRYRGDSYTSHGIFPATLESDYETRSAAESVVEGLDEGETVTAYVNPDSPGNAFLKTKRSTDPLKIAVVGLLAALTGAGFAFNVYRS